MVSPFKEKRMQPSARDRCAPMAILYFSCTAPQAGPMRSGEANAS
jgi:hypothetical protein